MTALPLGLPCTTQICNSGSDHVIWRRDRLAEARGVLADAPHHPDALVILAARVVCGHTDDPTEYAEANGLRRLLERRSLQTVTAAPLPTGGSA